MINQPIHFYLLISGSSSTIETIFLEPSSRVWMMLGLTLVWLTTSELSVHLLFSLLHIHRFPSIIVLIHCKCSSKSECSFLFLSSLAFLKNIEKVWYILRGKKKGIMAWTNIMLIRQIFWPVVFSSCQLCFAVIINISIGAVQLRHMAIFIYGWLSPLMFKNQMIFCFGIITKFVSTRA